MAQKLERFYGLRLRAHSTIDAAAYKRAQSELSTAVRKLQLGKSGARYGTYVTRLEVVERPGRFMGVDDIEERLETLDIAITVPGRQRELKRIFLLNSQIDQALWVTNMPPQTKTDADKFTIRSRIPGRYCRDITHFELLVVTAVSPEVRDRDRKLRIVATTRPTPTYASKFINGRGGRVKTELDFWLETGVQLEIDFDL